MEARRDSTPHLTTESSDLSDPQSGTFPTFTPSSAGTSSGRGQYESVPHEEEDTAYRGPTGRTSLSHGQGSAQGLRISFSEHDTSRASPDVTKKNHSPPSPETSRDLLSPNAARRRSQSLSGDTPNPDDQSLYDRSSPVSLYSPPSYNDDESTRRLRASTIGSVDPLKSLDEITCSTRRQIQTSKKSWLSITIYILSIYSTIFSAIWLGLAVAKPRYGRHIANTGNVRPSTASTLFAAFAKTIELSFVTVLVTALGQILSHTAIRQNSKGITVADMLLRQWIMQPGSLITHFETVRYSALTLLGALTLTATLMSMFYTTASDALVNPKLKFGGQDRKVLVGRVQTIFGNETFQMERCKTPISNADDPYNAGMNCMEIEHSGQAYHNFMQYLPAWDDFVKASNSSAKMSERPRPVGMLWDNTTVTGSWVEEIDTPKVSARFNRVINNVTLALPHAALVGAVQSKNNSILQPQDFNGLGEYYVHASVPAPSISVLCAGMTFEELKPIIYTEWPDYNGTRPNSTNWPQGFLDKLPHPPSFINSTAVDDVFGWGEKYKRRPPIFPNWPQPFKTVLNASAEIDEQGNYPDSIYVLATSNATNSSQLCSLRMSMYPHCSAKYHASLNLGTLMTVCDDEKDSLMYSKSHHDATAGVLNYNWTQVANRWVITMSLGAGITDDPASNARLLTQLMLPDPPLPHTPSTSWPNLNLTRPSLAEALAVQAGCTVILPAIGTPLLHTFSPPDASAGLENLANPFWEKFNATVRSQEYSSGYNQPWQGIFYLILLGVLLLNVAVLLYFLIPSSGLITDWMEPHNLFALAINSPASRALEGSCGGGPEKAQMRSKWHVEYLDNREHFFVRSMDEPLGEGDGEGVVGPRQRKKQRKSGRYVRNSGGWEELGVEGSPVGEQWERLSKRPSSLF